MVEHFVFKIALCFPLIFQALNPISRSYEYMFQYYDTYYKDIRYWFTSFPGTLPESEYLFVGVHFAIFIVVFTLVIVLEKLNQRSIIRGPPYSAK